MKLKSGEIICSKCNGKGFIKLNDNYQNKNNFFISKKICSKCNGKGKLNWLENVFGTKSEPSMLWEFTSTKRKYKETEQDIKWDNDQRFKNNLEKKIISNLI